MKTTIIFILMIMVAAIVSSSVTYAVFSDVETSTGNVMTVGTDYWVFPPNYDPIYDNQMEMKRCNKSVNADGIFKYIFKPNYFFWEFDGNVPYADPNSSNETNKTWALIIELPDGSFAKLGSGLTDNRNQNHKHLTLEGYYQFDGDFKTFVYLIELDNFNAMSMNFSTFDHCARTEFKVHYIDTSE